MKTGAGPRTGPGVTGTAEIGAVPRPLSPRLPIATTMATSNPVALKMAHARFVDPLQHLLLAQTRVSVRIPHVLQTCDT